MRNNYVIKWKSKVNGRVGRGTKLFTREEAQRLANELNREYPDIEHQVVPADSRREPTPVHAETLTSNAGPGEPSSTRFHALSVR